MHLMKHIATSPVSVKARSLSERLYLRTRNDRGQSLVEFAVCLPVLLLILTGIFTFGIALNNYLMMTNAVSIGARYLAISRGQTSYPMQYGFHSDSECLAESHFHRPHVLASADKYHEHRWDDFQFVQRDIVYFGGGKIIGGSFRPGNGHLSLQPQGLRG